MNAKRAKSFAIVSIADGEKLGTIDRVFVDPARRQIVGFSLDPLRDGTAGYVETGSIRAFGQDALTVDNRSALRPEGSEGSSGAVDLADLNKQKVMTENGTYVGQVVSVEFDERTLRLTQIEVSPGFFKSNKVIPMDLVTSIGPDVLVVADTVCAPAEADALTPERRPTVETG